MLMNQYKEPVIEENIDNNRVAMIFSNKKKMSDDLSDDSGKSKQSQISKDVKKSLVTDFSFQSLFKAGSAPTEFDHSNKCGLKLTAHATEKKNEMYVLEKDCSKIVMEIFKKHIDYFIEQYEPKKSFFILYDLGISKKLNDMETYFNQILYYYGLVGLGKLKGNKVYFDYKTRYTKKFNATTKHNHPHLKLDIVSFRNGSVTSNFVVLLLPLFFIKPTECTIQQEC